MPNHLSIGADGLERAHMVFCPWGNRQPLTQGSPRQIPCPWGNRQPLKQGAQSWPCQAAKLECAFVGSWSNRQWCVLQARSRAGEKERKVKQEIRLRHPKLERPTSKELSGRLHPVVQQGH
eukprot:scaffold1414_cov15-Tisochrysis_lutea.AAC.1